MTDRVKALEFWNDIHFYCRFVDIKHDISKDQNNDNIKKIYAVFNSNLKILIVEEVFDDTNETKYLRLFYKKLLKLFEGFKSSDEFEGFK